MRWSFWWARAARRAALLKKPHRGFFARRDASAVPQLFESTRRGVTLVFLQKKKTSVFSTLVFLVGAGVSASRAAKKAPLGLFCPAGRKRRAAAVRIHTRGCVFGFLQKKKTSVFSTLVFLVGAGVSASRAAKKAPPGLFSRRNASAGPQLFESTRGGVSLGFCKRKRSAYFLR